MPSTSSTKFDDSEIYKIVTIGDTNTGKTNIITRYIEDKFHDNSRPTIGVEFFQKSISLNVKNTQEQVKLQIWDTAGQERFRSMASNYYRHAYGVLIVYDITEKRTFENIDNWLKEIRNNCGKDVEITLIGNKKDLTSEREVFTEDAKKYANKHKLVFYETSALYNKDKTIQNIFYDLAKRIRMNDKLEKFSSSTMNGWKTTTQNSMGGYDLERKKRKKNDSCC